MNRTTPVGPVTVSGWYKNTDGSVTEYTWRNGRLAAGRMAASWADVPSREEDLRAAIAEVRS